ncbi:SDR family oxidoreductase [Roseovarius sp. CAU 1744]|uniref:SDR family oxidoreductase n=1 Tax=Roseovarius sp. CAU 1744 TaxID=3140368 RepID=UPI00325BAE74
MNRRVLITAGASGIGLGLAKRFTAEGDRVALCDADAEAIARVQTELPGVIACPADVTDEAQIAAFFGQVDKAWGGVDVVCANAGTGGPAGRIEDLEYDAWRNCVGVNLFGAFLTCRWAAARMRAQGSGSIILTSSTAGLFGYPLRSPYAAAKWGIVGLTKTLAMELGPAGVRVNCICPGAVEGDRMERVLANESAATGTPVEELRASYVACTSLRTWVDADDLADMALFLASPAASKISGQILAVDGHTESIN